MKPAHILVVDDDFADRRLIRRAFRNLKMSNTLAEVEDGVEALAYLRNEGEYADAPKPDLVLLDLNMPRLSGQGFLKAVRADPELRHTVVVVLTTSEQEKGILETYNLGANSYIVKPPTLPQLMDIVQGLEHYWFQIVRIPAAPEPR